jgi:hypothetical protein
LSRGALPKAGGQVRGTILGSPRLWLTHLSEEAYNAPVNFIVAIRYSTSAGLLIGAFVFINVYPDNPSTKWFFWSMIFWFLFLGGFYWLHNRITDYLNNHYAYQFPPKLRIDTDPVYRAWNGFFLFLYVVSFLLALGFLLKGAFVAT